MKKFLFIASFLVIAGLSAFSQSVVNLPLISTGNSLARDTVTNTATKVWMKPIGLAHAAYGIQVVITNISGTLGGTLTPVVSNDGVTFSAVPTVTGQNGVAAYTVTTAATQSVCFTPPNGFLYYGVSWVGTGTMSGSLVARLVAK